MQGESEPSEKEVAAGLGTWWAKSPCSGRYGRNGGHLCATVGHFARSDGAVAVSAPGHAFPRACARPIRLVALGPRTDHNIIMLDLASELQKIYDSEINVRISWFWDAGFTVQLGDTMNGFLAEETVASAAEILPWLQAAIAHFYPDSDYTRGLDPDTRERSAKATFRPPRVGASVRCPHCGSPNAAGEMFDEVDVFVCNHCGQSVEVQSPRVQ